MGSGRWQFWIDRGGTFTDLVARDPTGALLVRKVLSRQPGRAGDPGVRAMAEVLGLTEGEPLPSALIDAVRLGTTVATNALLERRGATTVLLINRGLADALLIGDQHRPDLFALRIARALPLYGRVIEVEGRLDADGRELEPLQLDEALADQLRAAQADGHRSVAVALLHAYRYPGHEQRLGDWLRQLGFADVALSHRVSPLPRLVPRGHTTVVEAYVGPVLGRYLEAFQAALGPNVTLRVMQSSGGLMAPAALRAKDTILSGPAGGLVGAMRTAAAAGFGTIVGFDMGGTSTDVCYCDGPWERRDQAELEGILVQAPMLAIHTVAAGGGSVLHFDGQRLLVGPDSAGADPGPACYRRGGPLTISDANVLLGRLQPAWFPAVFGASGDQPLDPIPVRAQFDDLAARVALATGQCPSPEQLAEGGLEIAIERMAAAIRQISIQQGHDVRQAVLCCFGGAGGQHACALAAALGMTRVLLHPLAGVLSAYGLGLAEERVLQELVVQQPLSEDLLKALAGRGEELIAAARAQTGLTPEQSRVERRLLLRTTGSDSTLPLAWDRAERLREAFVENFRRRYGYAPKGPDGLPPWPVVDRLVVELVQVQPGDSAQPRYPAAEPTLLGTVAPTLDTTAVTSPEPTDRIKIFLDGRWQEVPLWQRRALRPGMVLAGPALIVEATGTNLLLAGWRGQVLPGAELLFEQVAGPASDQPGTDHDRTALDRADPVLLELYNHRFAAIAAQMGTRLQQTSASVNIRERLDFSCALFDGQGQLVANAPHIPVHLGSMGESVAALLRAIEQGQRAPLGPGDVVLSNDPYDGGTHLPDITAITPVFAEAVSGSPLFYVASRGHHADVGGITPGSMPAFSRTIEEEGLLLRNEPFLVGGDWDREAWLQRLLAGPHPVRNPNQLLADLQAQAAANQLGVRELERLVRQQGLAEVRAYMAHVQAHAAEAVRAAIDRLEGGNAVIHLDDGSRIHVAVSIDRLRRRARIDCSGSSAEHPGNLNAPLAITKAVVLYVFRCLVGEAIPLNAGCFEPLELVVPLGCLLNPRPPAAVVAGNVETSQALANALFLALGVQAGAQGTMNNLSFGNARYQYYETICGGTGAGCAPGGEPFAGASAVQSHMTNSHLTDPEVLEDRFPVRLERFAIRRGSGGAGRWRGGEGVVRELRFREAMTVSLLMGSRRVGPPGLAGGAPGACGRNTLVHPDGQEQELPGSTELAVPAGALLRIETPGGGGFGAPERPVAREP